MTVEDTGFFQRSRCAAGKADVENSPELCTEQSKELPFLTVSQETVQPGC